MIEKLSLAQCVVSRIPLGFFPTPFVELTGLTKVLGGPKLFMKRDDQTGLAFGGNKTRKLEFILADAIEKGCDTVVTAGASQSNHCRQTVAGAAKLGLDCHLVLGGKEPDELTGNLLLDKLLGCTIHWAGDNRKGEDIPTVCSQLEKKGKKPYVVPYGGSNKIGALGFAQAVKELDSQINDLKISHVVFASSSGGTHAGLMLGKAICNHSYELIGVNIDKDETGDISLLDYILELTEQTATMLGFTHDFSQEPLELNDDYVGAGYGVIGELEKEALTLTARTEGILLDPVYTGRAMGGLIHMVRSGRFNDTDNVLFWHTGGAPALFAYGEALGDLT